MEPGLVWLSLIPIFDLIWSFFIATWVPDSLRNEFQDRGRDDGSDYGKRIGLARAIIGVLYFFVNLVGYGPSRDPAMGIIFLPLGLVSLVLFIIFWVRIAGYSRELAALPYNFERVPDHVGDDDRDPGSRGPASDAIRPADPGAFRPEDRDRY